jgi:hypothetical protein
MLSAVIVRPSPGDRVWVVADGTVVGVSGGI